MEKTLARAIYKMMEVGKEYTSSDLSRLIGDDYYKYIPEDMQPCSVLESCQVIGGNNP